MSGQSHQAQKPCFHYITIGFTCKFKNCRKPHPKGKENTVEKSGNQGGYCQRAPAKASQEQLQKAFHEGQMDVRKMCMDGRDPERSLKGDMNHYHVTVARGRNIAERDLALETALKLVRPVEELHTGPQGIIVSCDVIAPHWKVARNQHPLGYRFDRETGKLPDAEDISWAGTGELRAKKVSSFVSEYGVKLFRKMEGRKLKTKEDPSGVPPNGTTVFNIVMKPPYDPEGQQEGYEFPFIMKDEKDVPEDWSTLKEEDLEHDPKTGDRKINPEVWIWM